MTLSAADAERLLKAIDAYDTPAGQVYDELLLEVGGRLRANGHAGKLDLAALAVWKRSAQGSWIGNLMNTPESVVVTATRASFEAAERHDDLGALVALRPIPGYCRQEAMASALLTAYDPIRYGVLDRRALFALEQLGLPLPRTTGMTLRYFEVVRSLRDHMEPARPGLTARKIDKGLYVLGERPRRPRRVRT